MNFQLSILILQFNSYKQPLVILAVIPIAMGSALMGLFLTNQVLTFVAMMSLIALMGIVVNNAIVLLDAINGLREEGMTIALMSGLGFSIILTMVVVPTIYSLIMRVD